MGNPLHSEELIRWVILAAAVQVVAPTTAVKAKPLDGGYPGRPVGICTSRGHTCSSLIYNQPYHVVYKDKCEVARSKTLRDRFGRPLTIRYTFKKRTFVANREQVCSLGGHKVSTNRTRISEHIDDYIWKNLSIWSKEFEHKWADPAKKKKYIKCHAVFASFHCSSMFPNCTAERNDRKPALPCRELCEEVVKQCTWTEDWSFLPFLPKCKQYPSRNDPYKRCTEVSVTAAYAERVAGVRRSSTLAIAAITSVVLAMVKSYV